MAELAIDQLIKIILGIVLVGAFLLLLNSFFSGYVFPFFQGFFKPEDSMPPEGYTITISSITKFSSFVETEEILAEYDRLSERIIGAGIKYEQLTSREKELIKAEYLKINPPPTTVPKLYTEVVYDGDSGIYCVLWNKGIKSDEECKYLIKKDKIILKASDVGAISGVFSTKDFPVYWTINNGERACLEGENPLAKCTLIVDSNKEINVEYKGKPYAEGWKDLL